MSLKSCNFEQLMSIKKIIRFYIDGFRGMTWGRPLWVLIIVKLVIMFGILKVFFFQSVPPTINQ